MLIKRHIYMWWTKRWKSMGGGDKKEGYWWGKFDRRTLPSRKTHICWEIPRSTSGWDSSKPVSKVCLSRSHYSRPSYELHSHFRGRKNDGECLFFIIFLNHNASIIFIRHYLHFLKTHYFCRREAMEKVYITVYITTYPWWIDTLNSWSMLRLLMETKIIQNVKLSPSALAQWLRGWILGVAILGSKPVIT
jgi:hypothetical protein